MTDSAHSKKRKRQDEGEGEVTLALSEAASDAVGPVLVAFPSLQPPQSTAFKYYVKNSKKAKNEAANDFASQGGIIAGETDAVEFYSAGSDSSDYNNQSCQYLVGIRDKTTNEVILRRVPVHILKREVKALKSLDPIAASQATDERNEARNALGEAFGSKKSKQAIRAAERNRVDVSAMKGVVEHLQDSVDAGTVSLPSQEAAKAAADESRPIPRCNVHAKSPDEVYALHDIITEAEMNSISVVQILSASNDGQRNASLPYQRSSWVNSHLVAECSAAKPNKTRLKTLYYISSMMLFRTASRDVGDKSEYQKRMSSVPSEVMEGLLARFTERSRDSTKAQVTKHTETLLLTYMFALCLRVDRYAIEPTSIAADLKMPVPVVATHFKHLGCKYEVLTVADRTRLGLGPAVETERKRCILRIPFDFPKQRVKRRN